jgi:hypothetical protein
MAPMQNNNVPIAGRVRRFMSVPRMLSLTDSQVQIRTSFLALVSPFVSAAIKSLLCHRGGVNFGDCRCNHGIEIGIGLLRA